MIGSKLHTIRNKTRKGKSRKVENEKTPET